MVNLCKQLFLRNDKTYIIGEEMRANLGGYTGRKIRYGPLIQQGI